MPIPNAGEEIVKKACDFFISSGVRKCSGVKFQVMGYRHSLPNSELDQFGKIDLIIYLRIFFPNNVFEEEDVQLPLQVKLRHLKKETCACTNVNHSEQICRKIEKKKRKRIQEKLHHQYCNPWVPIIVVVVDKSEKPRGVHRALKNLFCQTTARSIRAAIKARKLIH